MKLMSKTLITAVACFGITGFASAAPIPFSDTIDFSGSGSYAGEDFLRVKEKYTYRHDIVFDPMAISIDNATLRINHIGNNVRAADNELWLLKGKEVGARDNWSRIGRLSHSSNATGWVIDTFLLGAHLFDESGVDSWSLKLRAREPGRDRERLRLGWSELTGTYTPVSVPEPGTLALLGIGLLGLGAASYRRAS